MSQFEKFIEDCKAAQEKRVKLNKVEWVDKPNCIIDYYTDAAIPTACIYIEAPGFNPDQFDIVLDKGMLTVSADKSATADEENSVLYEFNKKLYREFKVGELAVMRMVEYINGVLTIQLENHEAKSTAKKYVPNQPVSQPIEAPRDRNRAGAPGTTSGGMATV